MINVLDKKKKKSKFTGNLLRYERVGINDVI